MNTEIETIIHCEQGVRVSVSDFDENVWLHLSMRNGTSHAVLSRSEAELLVAGLQAILAQEVTA